MMKCFRSYSFHTDITSILLYAKLFCVYRNGRNIKGARPGCTATLSILPKYGCANQQHDDYLQQHRWRAHGELNSDHTRDRGTTYP